MGKWATGVQTTSASKRIELSYLLKKKLLVKGSKRSGHMNWTSDNELTGTIGLETRYFGDGDDYIRLRYTITINEVKTDLDYKIFLAEKESNLGKGKVLYMICSQSGYFCRILYLAYGSHYFKCRQAYRNRLYYPIQRRSKLDRYNSRFFELQTQLETEDQKRFTEKYNGHYTKRFIKKQRLEDLYHRMNYLRNQVFVQRIKKAGYPFDDLTFE